MIGVALHVSLLLFFALLSAGCGEGEGERLGLEACSGCPRIEVEGEFVRRLAPDALHAEVVGGVSNAEGPGRWRLRHGSRAIVSDGGVSLAQGRFSLLLPTLAGENDIEIAFGNARGTSRLSMRLESPRSDPIDIQIWVVWDNPLSDLDLHLLRPGGTLESANDCYWANCRAPAGEEASPPPDWGIIGDRGDDPLLDLEAHHGFGPESIVLDGAEEGSYQVVLTNSGDAQQGPSLATVIIVLAEEVEAIVDAFVPAEENATQPVALIDWPAKTVRPVPETD